MWPYLKIYVLLEWYAQIIRQIPCIWSLAKRLWVIKKKEYYNKNQLYVTSQRSCYLCQNDLPKGIVNTSDCAVLFSTNINHNQIICIGPFYSPNIKITLNRLIILKKSNKNSKDSQAYFRTCGTASFLIPLVTVS